MLFDGDWIVTIGFSESKRYFFSQFDKECKHKRYSFSRDVIGRFIDTDTQTYNKIPVVVTDIFEYCVMLTSILFKSYCFLVSYNMLDTFY